MKFSLISDMHLDFPQQKTPYDKLEKNVIVAGDSSNGLVGMKFLNKLRRKGHDVFAIDGNHEHYGNVSNQRRPTQTTERFREENPNLWQFDGIPIIGCCGWYPVSNGNIWADCQNDCANIFGLYPAMAAAHMNSMAHYDYMFIRDQLDMLDPDQKAVVVTHTSPCVETLDPRFDGYYSNEWYYNPLMYRLLEGYSEKILVWCHGHTHAKADAEVCGVRVVCNSRGYPGENPDWEPLTIEV